MPEGVRVLDADRDLAEGILAPDLPEARRRSVARHMTLDPGPWSIGELRVEPGMYGLLVLHGLVAGRRTLEGRGHLEVVGDGDLLQPWVELGGETSIQYRSSWRVLAPTQLAVLDRAFALRLAPWPEVASALMNRLVLRSRRLALQLLIASATRIDERVHMLLWLLADRWGKVGPDGVLLTLPLTQAQLAEMVAARRPSVTQGLNHLHERVRPLGRGRWLLSGGPPGQLDDLRAQAALPPAAVRVDA